ncbi:hypothetical protein HYE60_07495 [Aggregatibacter actinomycetemcomitans]|uniref:hypothetical protein n=1 Tax=Aggregatibacter actinomycetemcomitans TaxID=714 RepID=UPI00197CA129|nr:hypothetical protein [Aggregatibacter actinomycetemcomitans]MBN6075086.1 hypothetical protein [Aggregatibacter actinomycetemcomitans]
MVNYSLIQFPFSNWNNLFIDDEHLLIPPVCVCSQIESDTSCNGKYEWGQSTICQLNKVVSNPFLLDLTNMRLLENKSFYKQGINFLDKGEQISRINKIISTYKIKKLKSEKMAKEFIIEHPLEKLLKDKEISYSLINSLIKDGMQFIYIYRYHDRADLTVILFFPENIRKLESLAKVKKINSYDDLTFW